MGYVPGFQYDVFISYAWVNNQPAVDENPDSGWVTQFRKRLRGGLDEKLGRIGSSAFFWDEAGMSRERNFDGQIEAALRSSATVVAFFSPGYLESRACCDEMRIFNEMAGDAHASGRLFLVRIDDVPQSDWPDQFQQWLRNVLGYQFFRKIETKGLTLRLDHDDDDFAIEFEMLRKGLSDKLKAMKQEAAQNEPPSLPDRPVVLIAQTTPDLRTARNALKSYCESAGVHVLPTGVFSADPDRFREEFDRDLRRCHVVVQLLSAAYSDRTPEFPEGIEAFQFARAHTAQRTILRWRNAATEPSGIDDELHRRFITAPDVRSDLPAVFHQAVVEAAQSNFEIARDIVHGEGQRESTTVLVRADDIDADATREITGRLAQANINCRVARNGVPLVDRLRKLPFAGLIVLLGRCPPSWIEQQGDELMAVDLSLKDQTPLRAYCHCQQPRVVPPYVGHGMLELSVPDELDRLIQVIRSRGADA